MNQLIFEFAEPEYPHFDTFLGSANRELLHVLQSQQDRFVYVWGQEGVGKSHLLRAWVAQAEQAGQKAMYIDAQSQNLSEAMFDAEYLAVDQVDKLNSTEQALLFDVFNDFRNRQHGWLLFSADVPPSLLNMREDLRTRMGFCLVYDIKPLSDQEKIAALMDMAAARQMVVETDVFQYLISHWRRDMNSLVKMLHILDAYAVSMGKRITPNLVRQLLLDQEKK